MAGIIEFENHPENFRVFHPSHHYTSLWRTIFLVFYGTFVGVLAFSGWYAWFSWHRYEQNSQYRLTLESDMVAAVTQKLLDGHVSGLQHPRRARTLLLDYQKAASDIASANLIAPNGQVIASTAVPAGSRSRIFAIIRLSGGVFRKSCRHMACGSITRCVVRW